MPQPKNHLLRTIVPIVLGIAGIGVAISVFNNTAAQKSAKNPPAPLTTTAPASATGQPAGAPPAAQPATTPPAASPSPQPEPTAPQPALTTPPATTTAPTTPATPAAAGPLDGLHAQVFDASTPAPAPLGSLDEKSDARFQV